MSKKLVLLIVGMLLLSVAACQPVSLPDAQAQYCADLKVYAQEVQDVRDLPEDATVEDFDAALEEVDEAFRALENSAWDLADAQNDALKPAYQEMRASLDEISADTPVAEASAIVTESVDTYLAAIQEVTDVSCVEKP